MPSDKLTRREVDFVLRRAAEIDTQHPARDERSNDETLSVVDLVRLGEEAGLRGDAVEQALTELRRGAAASSRKRPARSRARWAPAASSSAASCRRRSTSSDALSIASCAIS